MEQQQTSFLSIYPATAQQPLLEMSATTLLMSVLVICTFILSIGNGAATSSNKCMGRLRRRFFRLFARCPPVNAVKQSATTSQSTEQLSKGPPPGPKAWPVIGSLHLLAKYEVPFEGFTQLSRIYGDLFSITLGSTPCVVVNSFPLIKEVLITKGPHFGGRPNFIRYDILFGGDRDNCKSFLFKYANVDVIIDLGTY